MSSGGSVSFLLNGLKIQDQAAVEELWKRYCRRLIGLARKKLGNRQRRMADEEDIANSAFRSLCSGVGADGFPTSPTETACRASSSTSPPKRPPTRLLTNFGKVRRR